MRLGNVSGSPSFFTKDGFMIFSTCEHCSSVNEVVEDEYVIPGMHTVQYASHACMWLSGQEMSARANRFAFFLRLVSSPVWDKSAALNTPSVFDASETHFLLMVYVYVGLLRFGMCTVFLGS